MARGFCPNHECPNIDILDTERPCPTCGREVTQATPKEYWRTRTIKMMHSHEIAEIAEIQEVARRVMGEASLVPKALETETTSTKQDQAPPEEADLGEIEATEAEYEEASDQREMASDVESAVQIEEVQLPDSSAAQVDTEAIDQLTPELHTLGHAESIDYSRALELEELVEPLILHDLERELETKSEGAREPESLKIETHGEAEPPESESSEVETETPTIKTSPTQISAELEPVSDAVSAVEEVPFVEGLFDSQTPKEGSEDQPELAQGEDGSGVPESLRGLSPEELEAKEIESEIVGEAASAEVPEWREDHLIPKSPVEQASSPERLPDDGGVERPASPVRIITFREGSTEIGICPYCGRFIRGSDMSRHKLKHRMRNVFGLQGEVD